MRFAARKAFFLILCVFFLCTVSFAFAKNSPEQINIAKKALAASIKLLHQDATAADVDAFLAFCTDDFVYEDPVVKMKVEGKSRLHTGMANHLGGSRNPHDVLTKQIAVANVVVFEHTVSFELAEENGGWKPITRRQVSIFEFEGNKIRRVMDYWVR